MDLSKFNDKQKEAILSKEKKIVVVAPPGAGKTHTMTGAIQYFIEENPEANNVVAITFTVKGSDDLKERIKSPNIRISTIHSWSRAELIRLSEKHGFRVKLLEEPQIISIIKPEMQRKNLQTLSEFIVNSVLNHCLGTINPDLEPHIKAKYDAVAEYYQEFKRERHLYDFTDLPLYLKDKLTDYNEFIEVDALFVDEFQDVDPVQLSVFSRVISNKYFYIGDVDQAIYMFRGATQEIFTHLDNDFVTLNLIENYRSYQNILNYATEFRKFALPRVGDVALAVPFKNERDSHIVATRGNRNGSVYVGYSLYDGHFPRDLVVDGKEVVPFKPTLTALMKKNDFHILVRTNRESRELQKLGFERVMTIHKSKGLEFDNVIVVDNLVTSEEDVNVGYVALTRAKNILVVSPLNILKEVVAVLPEQHKTVFKTKMGF